MKALLLIGVILSGALAFMAWYRWDSAQNRGFEFGYYGDFNRVRHALTQISGVTIARDWANSDVTLEEFGFDVTTGAGDLIHLDFQEADLTRNLAGEPLTRALTQKIKAGASLSNAEK